MPTEERSAEVPISESDLVEIIKNRVNEGVLLGTDEVGVGDDAAVVRFDSQQLVLTADAMVDGVHFLSGSTRWYDIGWKCMVSNQSDIAAMGAVPEHAVMTLAIPDTTKVTDLDDLLTGAIDALNRFGGRLVGGDTVSSEIIMLNVALTGRLCDPGRVLTRNSARQGQMIAVTGPMGGSAGGLDVMNEMVASNGTQGKTEDHARLLEAHLSPTPRVDLAPVLVAAGIECAMDVSDGLLIDLERICVASGVDAIVYADQVPWLPSLMRVYPDRARQFALTGGEDYEILFVGDANAVSQVTSHERVYEDRECRVIGEIVARRRGRGQVTVLDKNQQVVEFDVMGWDHFAR